MHLSIRSLMAFSFAAFLTFTSGMPASASGPRISTGQELYEACKVLVEHGLKREGPTPRQGLYCRQYIAGYFATVKYVNEDDDAKTALGVPFYAPDCIDISGPRSYEQLAAKVMRNGEWHPDLLDRPAIELVRRAFGVAPPCVR